MHHGNISKPAQHHLHDLYQLDLAHLGRPSVGAVAGVRDLGENAPTKLRQLKK